MFCCLNELPVNCQHCKKLRVIYIGFAGKNEWNCASSNPQFKKNFETQIGCSQNIPDDEFEDEFEDDFEDEETEELEEDFDI